MDRIEKAHAVLAALLHTAVAHDPLATHEGFQRARDLGLITNPNPVLTPIGRGILMSLGLMEA